MLVGLGDRRYVRRVVLAPPAPVTLLHVRGYYAGKLPPPDAEWAYISVHHPKSMVAQWEAGLVAGALRDGFCAARGRPLVGWTAGGRGTITISDRAKALGQRFPNPSPAAFRRAVARAAREYDFRVVSLRLLRPLQIAPFLVVETDRSRKAFVADVPKIMEALDPTSRSGRETAFTFEGFFLEARDAKGPFVRVDDVHRGETEGGQWSWNRCDYPYATLGGPVGAKPCP